MKVSSKRCCRICLIIKPIIEFYKRKDLGCGGHDTRCKKCVGILSQENYKNNEERYKKYAQEYSGKNRNKIYAYQKTWANKNPDKISAIKDRNRLKQYNINFKDYQRIFDSQNGCCGICGTKQSNLKYKLNIDHCHKTGKVRGLLCMPCNRHLGGFKDSIEILEMAIKYLRMANV